MTPRHHKSSTYLTLSAGIACALLAIALLPLLTQTALADLPPRPTPRPTPAPFPPPPPPSTGGWIELRVQFPQTWPWADIQWQDLWTVVQYQRGLGGDWYDVEGGWQGELNDIVIGEDREFVGKQVWWVAEEDLGRGPFRWLVYNGEGGELLATSEPFYLPDSSGRAVTVEVSPVP